MLLKNYPNPHPLNTPPNNIFERGREVDNPLLSLLKVGSSSSSDNTQWITICVSEILIEKIRCATSQLMHYHRLSSLVFTIISLGHTIIIQSGSRQSIRFVTQKVRFEPRKSGSWDHWQVWFSGSDSQSNITILRARRNCGRTVHLCYEPDVWSTTPDVWPPYTEDRTVVQKTTRCTHSPSTVEQFKTIPVDQCCSTGSAILNTGLCGWPDLTQR